MTNLGYIATFRIDTNSLQHLHPEPLMEQLGFTKSPTKSYYIRQYTRSMHQFALWIDVNNMAPKIIEAEWIVRNEK
ncbi:hypothetical protein BH20ACI2_BH20ACI2_19890 [soil metagenome]